MAASALGTTAGTQAYLTIPGTPIGTVAFMSPEQARGEELDARSDLFSFGAVLYEIATGRPPFTGNTTAVIFNAILSGTVAAPATLNPQLPPDLDAVISKALERDRDLRYQSAAELRADLKRIRRDSETRVTGPARRPGQQRRLWQLMGGVSAVALLATALAVVLWPQNPMVPVSEWEQIIDYADAVSSPSLSPDGRMLTLLRGPRTVNGPGDVYVMMLPKGPMLQLTHQPAQEKQDPVFSPDGATMAFTVPYETWTVPVGGGKSQLWLPNASGLQWVDANTLLFSEMLRAPHMRIATSDPSLTRPRAVYVPEDPMGMAHRSYLSPDRRWVLVAAHMVRKPNWVWLPCRVVPLDGSSPGRLVGPPDAACTSGAWSPDGKWIYLSTNASGAYHIWRQRFPDGEPEQITLGPTEEEGVTMAADGRSLITAVGMRRVAVAVHDPAAERIVVAEGRAGLAEPDNGSPFSPDGKKVYYLQLPRTTNNVSATNLANFDAGELRQLDLTSGQTEAVVSGSNVNAFSLASDGNRMVFVRQDQDGSQMWLASLDRHSPPRQLPPKWAERPRFAGDYIFYQAQQSQDTTRDGQSLVVRRIRLDGTGDESVWTKEFWRATISPSGRHLTVTTRSPAEESWPLFRLTIVDWQNGQTYPVCTECKGFWSDNGAWFVIAKQTGGGEVIGNTYLLPVSSSTGLPDLPPRGFAKLEDAARAKGARVINVTTQVAVGPTPDIYALVRDGASQSLSHSAALVRISHEPSSKLVPNTQSSAFAAR